MYVYAQELIIRGRRIEGPLKNINTVWDLISRLLNFFIPFAGFLIVLSFILAGYDLLTAQGNPEKVSSAKKKIMGSVIGLIILSTAFLIVKLASFVLKLPGGSF